MTCKILLARVGENRRKSMAANSLESLADTRSLVTIIDEQGRAPKFHHMARNRGYCLVAHRRCLDDFTAAIECEPACCNYNVPFLVADMLPDRQSIKKLIGDEE